jgi:hypothetical protein
MMYGSIMKSVKISNADPQFQLSMPLVHNALQSMIKERLDRTDSLQLSLTNSLHSKLFMNGPILQQSAAPTVNKSQIMSKTITSTTSSEPKKPPQELSKFEHEDEKSLCDNGVSDAIWTQLQLDI